MRSAILDMHVRYYRNCHGLQTPTSSSGPRPPPPHRFSPIRKNWGAVRSLCEHTMAISSSTPSSSTRPVGTSIPPRSSPKQSEEAASDLHKFTSSPSGNMLPLRESFTLCREWIRNLRFRMIFNSAPDWRPAGDEASSPSRSIGPLICFEDTLRVTSRGASSKLGAQLFVTLTNDAMVPAQCRLLRQHFNHALFRCAETKTSPWCALPILAYPW